MFEPAEIICGQGEGNVATPWVNPPPSNGYHKGLF